MHVLRPVNALPILLLLAAGVGLTGRVLADRPPKKSGAAPPADQQAAVPPSTNPQEFFDKLFGEPSAEEDVALEEIEISPEEEVRFGRQLVEEFLADLKRQKLRVVRKGKDVAYLKALVETLRPAMRNADRYERITVYVIDSPLTDAKSFPGGTLFFYSGLLNFAENEAAIAGVVAHELSHLDHGHQLLPLRRTRLMERSFTSGAGGFDPQRFFERGAMLTRLVSRPFRPQDESTADRDATDWLYGAGYDPRELAGLFEKLHARDRPQQQLPVPSFFRTHPYHRDRALAIEKRHDELQERDPRDDLYRGRTNLRKRIPRSQQKFAEP